MSTTQAALDELDEETFRLIIALQLEDAASIELQNNDGDLEPSDSTTACRLFADQLRQVQEVRHREGEVTRPAETIAPEETIAPAETIAAAAVVKAPDVACVSCQDQVPSDEALQVPCNHHYCIGCLEQLHRASMIEESLYPPRCCRQNMPWEDVKNKVDAQLATAFEGKKEELDSPAGNRTYCSDTACAKFIGAALIANDIATCPSCSKATCAKCKTGQHDRDCPKDEAVKQTLQLAKEEGWQRCSKCGSVIDLKFGCYHITCKCSHEFCYLCGVDWKTCPCPQWDDQRLEARAEQIVARRPAARGARRAEQVRQEANNLVGRHNCDHDHWTRVGGGGQCEECTNWLPYFTMVCDQCRLQVCRGCRRNVL